MNSRTTTLKTDPQGPSVRHDLAAQLAKIGLRATAGQLDDCIARATKQRLSPRALLEQIAQAETTDRAQRNLQRLLGQARIGRFKPMVDFDWNWPKKIDRELIERALTLDFINEGRNLILLGANGLGKTMIAKNIAHSAVMAGHSVLFRTASDLLADLQCDSPQLRRRKFSYYARPRLFCIDEVGYLSYDPSSADLLYEVINRRYERSSLLITTNRAFKDWNDVFPNATCIATLLDRLTHHADITVIEGQSFRVRESELESVARRKKGHKKDNNSK
jgi:DNA replication protein DnaC